MFKVRALKTNALLANIGGVQENLEGDADGLKGTGKNVLVHGSPLSKRFTRGLLTRQKNLH